MKLTLTYGKPYVFANADHDDDRTYVFFKGDENGATFEEFRHNPADGSEEDLGSTVFNAYQISLLHQVRAYYLPVGDLNEFFGSAAPICMDDQEASRLYDEYHGIKGANDADDVPFDEVFREASDDEIKRYGTYDSWFGTTTEPETE